MIPIILELGVRPHGPMFASGYPFMRTVNCETGKAIGPGATADVRTHINGTGHLLLQWRTDGSWDGSCRSLVVRFGLDGWSGADASSPSGSRERCDATLRGP